MIRDRAKPFVLVDFDLLGVPDGAFLLAVLVDFLRFEPVDAIGRAQLTDLPSVQRLRTAYHELAIEVDFDDSTEVLLVVKLHYFMIANHPYVAGNNLGPKATDVIFGAEFPDL